jgi:hypothetical protein
MSQGVRHAKIPSKNSRGRSPLIGSHPRSSIGAVAVAVPADGSRSVASSYTSRQHHH